LLLLGREPRYFPHAGRNLGTISKIQVFFEAESSAALLPEPQTSSSSYTSQDHKIFLSKTCT